MPAIEGKAAIAWIDGYVEKHGAKLLPVAEGLRRLVRKTVAGVQESVNPWKIATFEWHGPMCFFMIGKNHVTFGFLRGTALADAGELLEGTGKNLRHVKLRTVADLEMPELRKLIVEAARLNRKEPVVGMKVSKKESACRQSSRTRGKQ